MHKRLVSLVISLDQQSHKFKERGPCSSQGLPRLYQIDILEGMHDSGDRTGICTCKKYA